MHRIQEGADVQLLGSGAILREVLAGAELLAGEWGVEADVWSVTSFTELARDGNAAARHARLHPGEQPPEPYVAGCLSAERGPVVAATDYQRLYAEQIRPWVPGRYEVLGTDGYGRSDYRAALRRFFEVDRFHVVVAALHALGRGDEAARAIVQYEIDPEGAPPWRR
jgi:pyruvate dehydrogenase E1 component